MNNGRSHIPLDHLLLHCYGKDSAEREAAWKEFISRYKTFIYQAVTRRCLSWRVSRLRRQLSDVVNDIVSEVFTLLLNSLDQFRAVDNETKFRFWLATVCNRAAGRYLKREFYSEIVDPDFEDLHHYIHQLEFDTRWELYESIIDKLRMAGSATKRNLERDINLFQLYIWSDLSQPTIQRHPCYADIGHRVIDNVINRLRDSLKNEQRKFQ